MIPCLMTTQKSIIFFSCLVQRSWPPYCMRLEWEGSNSCRPGTSHFSQFTLSGVARIFEIAGTARTARFSGVAGIGKLVVIC